MVGESGAWRAAGSKISNVLLNVWSSGVFLPRVVSIKEGERRIRLNCNDNDANGDNDNEDGGG